MGPWGVGQAELGQDLALVLDSIPFLGSLGSSAVSPLEVALPLRFEYHYLG